MTIKKLKTTLQVLIKLLCDRNACRITTGPKYLVKTSAGSLSPGVGLAHASQSYSTPLIPSSNAITILATFSWRSSCLPSAECQCTQLPGVHFISRLWQVHETMALALRSKGGPQLEIETSVPCEVLKCCFLTGLFSLYSQPASAEVK